MFLNRLSDSIRGKIDWFNQAHYDNDGNSCMLPNLKVLELGSVQVNQTILCVYGAKVHQQQSPRLYSVTAFRAIKVNSMIYSVRNMRLDNLITSLLTVNLADFE